MNLLRTLFLTLLLLAVILLPEIVKRSVGFPPPMKIVGWNCGELIYEDAAGNPFMRDHDGHYVAIGVKE